MEPHVRRMVTEFNQHNPRTEALGVFIGKGEVYKTLPQEDQDLLAKQYEYMCRYREVLADRLRRVGVDPYTQPQAANLSFGEKLVGLDFNPAGDAKVHGLKVLAATMADLVNDHWQSKEHTMLDNIIYDSAIQNILNAQMNCVKLVTNRH